VPQANVIIEICPVLLFTLYCKTCIVMKFIDDDDDDDNKNIAYNIMKGLIFYADKIMVMGKSKNLRENLMLAKYTCFTVPGYIAR